jgi:hypothetical protein
MPQKQVWLGCASPPPVVLGDRTTGITHGTPWQRSTVRFAAATGVATGVAPRIAEGCRTRFGIEVTRSSREAS